MRKVITSNAEYFDPQELSGRVKDILIDLQDHDAGKLPEEISNYGDRQLIITVEVT